MGGGDLNMKKSWHVHLNSNMEKVWLKEKSALEERKKMAELRKEQEQERAVQELQRLQQEAGGAKREQRVEWMYAAPAEGNGPNAEELEAYLLGKKRVDKLLKGNEEKLMAAPSTATSGSFTSLQNANSARDTAAKIREDPLLFIKRQEQASYEKILKNPKRLKELRAAREAGLTPASLSSQGGSSGGMLKKAKKDETKEERRIRKECKRDREEGRHGSGGMDYKRSRRDEEDRNGSSSHRRSRSPPPPSSSHHPRSNRYEEDDRRHSRNGGRYEDRGRDNYNDNRRNDDRRNDDIRNDYDRPSTSTSSSSHHQSQDRQQRRSRSRSRSPLSLPRKQRSSSPVHQNRQRSRSPPRHSNNSNSRSSPYIKPEPTSSSSTLSQLQQPYRRPPTTTSQTPTEEQEAALKVLAQAKLAAMQSSAQSLSSSRNARLTALELEDSLVLKKEEESREKSRLEKVGPSFMRDSEKKVFSGGMDLGERMKRSGRVGMVGDRN